MTIDTNIRIAYLNGEESVMNRMKAWREDSRALFISSITVAEVLSLPVLMPTEMDRVKLFLEDFISLPFDNRLAEFAAYFRRAYRLDLPDAAIAATAFSRRHSLVTRDREFHKIRELEILEI